MIESNVLQKLINPTNSFEGAGITPPIKNGFRIQSVNNLKIVKSINKLGGTQVTLSFNEENTPAKTLYYIMAYFGEDVFNWTTNQNIKDESITKLKNIQGPFIALGSPATVFLQSEVEIPAYITITTRTPGGIVSEILSQSGVSLLVSPQGSYYIKTTSAYTIPFDKHNFVVFADGTITITLPDINQVIDGYECEVKNIGTGNVTVQGSVAAQTIDGATSETITTRYEAHRYHADTTDNVWRII